MRRILLILALIVFVAAPAGAQGLTLSFNSQGLVSIDATSVPVRTILNEWGKLGGTTVVGAERISGAPLTLKLVDVPEAQALDIILRSVAGYMAAPRGAVAGASIFDRILVLATSSAPAPAAARPSGPANNPGSTAGTQRFIPPRPAVQRPTEEDDEEAEEDPNPPNAPVFTFPQPGQAGFQPGVFNPPQGMQGNPVTLNPLTGSPQSITINPASPPAAPTGYPTTPFGGTGAAQPGMIQQPLPQPTQPGPAVRPPG
ncbi:MAG: hypothetical protein A3J29_20940 [Acidobacteria bacterium RIFCSPLOWO2_12_FULL_67_14b]|nr:MAG: hypothetical protein A3J29_20940 [Acidobacteria bacterium RIFCSPLOWO2_12_FULL_67_14b]